MWTICTDVKLPSGCSVLLFFGSTISSFNLRRGMECASDVSIQRRRICCTVIWIGDAQSTYLLNLFHFRQWRPAKPSTGMSFDFPFLHYGLCCIRTFLRASFPIGFKPLYGFRNLIYCWLRQMEQLHLIRMVKEFFFIGFLAYSHPFSPVRLYWIVCARAMHSTSVIR